MEAYKSTASQEPRILAATNATFVLGFTATVLRFVCRKMSGIGFWWDDWLCLAGTTINFISWVIYITLLQYFLGHHIGAVNMEDFPKFGRANYWGQIAYPMIMMFAKLSILALYWRVFSRAARWPVIAAAVAAVLVGIVWALVIALQCNPVSQAWDLLAKPRNCLNSQLLLIYPPVPSIILDAIIMVMPLPYIFRLNMRLSQKILVSLIFVVGSFIMVVSILRLVLVHNLNVSDPDVTWNVSDVTLWTGIETNLASFCISLPTLRPCFTFITTGSFIGSSKRSTAGHHGTGVSSTKRSRPSIFGRSQTKEQRSWPMESTLGRNSTGNASDSEPIVDQQITVTKQWDIEYKAST